MSELVVCRSTPITGAKQLAAIAGQRNTRDFRFGDGTEGNLVGPIDAYAVCFQMTVDPLIRERLADLFGRTASELERGWFDDRKGYIYAFHDLGDPQTVLKIGYTVRNPYERLREWNRSLSSVGGEGRHLVLLFAYPTVAARFAEKVVFEALRCERIAKRLNANTGDELDEFFEIRNFMALKVFVRHTTRYINRFVIEQRAHAASYRQQQ